MARKFQSHKDCEYCQHRAMKRKLKRAKEEIRRSEREVSDKEALKYLEAKEKAGLV